MTCTRIVKSKCPRGHSLSLPCAQANSACRPCIQEDRIKERKRERDVKLEAERQRRQAAYSQQLAEAQDEVSHLKRRRHDELDNAQRTKIIEQYYQEIRDLKDPVKMAQIVTEDKGARNAPTSPMLPGVVGENEVNGTQNCKAGPCDTSKPRQAMPTQKTSKARSDWQHQKEYFNARNPDIDTLMDMVGLESVKEKFLAIKSKVDVSLRQNVDLSRERFGSVLLGNPGTGKTTVARLYARFLATVGVIPGQTFIETSGSSLASKGVSGCQKTIEQLLKDGGGVIFIDEAYSCRSTLV